MVRLFPPSIGKLSAARDAHGLRDELVRAVHHPQSPRMQEAANALIDLGDEGVEVLIEAIMTDPDGSRFGWWYEKAFERTKGPRAAELLVGHLFDAREKARIAAARILADLDGELVVEALVRAMEDPSPTVRLLAASGLAARRDPRSVEPLLELLVNGPNQFAAVSALGDAGDPRALPALRTLRAVSTRSDLVRNIDLTVSAIEVAEENRRRREEAGISQVELQSDDAIIARLRTISSALRVIPMTHPALTTVVGPGVQQARDQIPNICRNIDDAVAALRTNMAPDGGAIEPWQVGRGLAALVEDVSGPGFRGLMLTVLDSVGVTKLESEVDALREVATALEGSRRVE